MKRIAILLTILIASTALFSQPRVNDQRTVATKIADLLMKFPPQSAEDLNLFMSELAGLGEPAIVSIASKLAAPGKGDDVIFRYALSGLSKYLASGSDREKMKQASVAFCNAIGHATNKEVKDFLFQELQYIAGDEAVFTAGSYLTDERLCDPAARVLNRINSDQSNKTLTEALRNAQIPQQVIIAGALAQKNYAPANEVLRGLVATPDVNLRKVVLRALANAGDMKSELFLASAAAKAGYLYDPSDATGSYFLFLQKAAAAGNDDFVAKTSKKLVKNGSIPSSARSAALKLLASTTGQKAVPLLMKALKAESADYRCAALELLGEMYTPAISASLQKLADKTRDDFRRTEIVRLLERKNDRSALPLIEKWMKSENKLTQSGAVSAFAKLAGKNGIPALLALLTSGNTETIPVAQSALMMMDGDGVAEEAALLLPSAGTEAKIALMEIIAGKKSEKHSVLIFNETANSNPNVRTAALKALASVVKAGDMEKIAGLLKNASGEEEIAALQEALYTAVKGAGDKTSQVNSLMGVFKNAGDKQPLFYNVLARIGGKEALAIVEKGFESNNPLQKDLAVNALSGWSDFAALDALYRISKNNLNGKYHDQTLASFIAGINKSENPLDSKVLMFRNAMKIASSTDQQKKILQGIAKNSSLLSLLFVSKYLDDPRLQQTAVQSVREIVTADSGLVGDVVEEIVKKTISLNKDSEAEYQKQELLKHLASLPQEEGFKPMFNGKDLTGWKGLVKNPIARAKMKPEELKEEQKKADELMVKSWKVKDGVLVFEGKGQNLCSEKMYADFELILDWRMESKGDGGIYLRGSPQVQTWDTTRVEVGAQVGSGGLYNNKVHRSTPLVVADNPIGEWNTFRIRMVGEKVTVYLNGILVVDDVIMENYWDRSIPIFGEESIELQAHGTLLEFRDIYVREIPRPQPFTVSPEEANEGFVPLFNGLTMDGWRGNTIDYTARDGMIVCVPSGKGQGNLYTVDQYRDFILRFEFQLTPGANNGLGIRTPPEGDAAYAGMELQILDNEAEIYKDLKPYQYHGSVYGVIAAKRGYLKPVGEWNYQEVQAIGNRIKVTLNGEVILDGDIAKASKNGRQTADGRVHPGLMNKTGHLGFLGHGSPLKFRNLRIKKLDR